MKGNFSILNPISLAPPNPGYKRTHGFVISLCRDKLFYTKECVCVDGEGTVMVDYRITPIEQWTNNRLTGNYIKKEKVNKTRININNVFEVQAPSKALLRKIHKKQEKLYWRGAPKPMNWPKRLTGFEGVPHYYVVPIEMVVRLLATPGARLQSIDSVDPLACRLLVPMEVGFETDGKNRTVCFHRFVGFCLDLRETKAFKQN